MSPPAAPVTILVVDDDPGVVRLIERKLRREGYRTGAALSGLDASRWLEGHQADLLLLDLKLPDVEGTDIITLQETKGRPLPFVIITGQGDERVAVEMMKRGALDYLVKDVNFIEFVPTVVKRALDQIAQQKRLAAAETELARSHAELECRVIERTAALVEANQALLDARQFAEATIEAVPASLAVLDERGVIVSVNQSWHQFAAANEALPEAVSTGVNYLAVCDTVRGADAGEAARFAAGIREVMSGSRPHFTMEYACHSADQQRWYVGYVRPFKGNGPHSVVIAHVDISERKAAEDAVRKLNNELELRVEQRTAELRLTNEGLREEISKRRKLEQEILYISEREQQRIGEDLHDDLGQRLAGTWLLSDALKKALMHKRQPEASDAEQISALLKDALALTRSLARGLHPVAIGDGGLVAALHELAARTHQMFRVACHCDCPPRVDMGNTTATHLYRIAQEAVTNAVKHGKAKRIDIQVSTNAHSTVLSVKNNGRPLPATPSGEGMGLRIMRYRADIIGGTLLLKNNSDNGGTMVLCTIPAAEPDQPST